MFLFDGNRIRTARKPGKIQKGNPVGRTGECKRGKGNIREGSREGKTGTVLELSNHITHKFSINIPAHFGVVC